MAPKLQNLEIPEIQARVHPISVEAYHRMIEAGDFDKPPVELIEDEWKQFVRRKPDSAVPTEEIVALTESPGFEFNLGEALEIAGP